MATHKLFGVLGLGLFGRSLAQQLAYNGAEVIAIDRNMDQVNELTDEVTVAVQADFTRLAHLKEAGIADCDTVIIASAGQLEDSILAIMHLEELGIDDIIVKTKNPAYENILRKVGADRVILPEVEVALMMGNDLMQRSAHTLMRLDEKFNILEFKAPSRWIGKTIMSLDLRRKERLNVIAIRKANQEYHIDFGPNYVIEPKDTFIVVTDSENSFIQ